MADESGLYIGDAKVMSLDELAAHGKKPRGQRGGGRPPVDSKTRARVRKLARAGKSQAAVAREVGLSRSTVARICAEAKPPITFDRSATQAAVAAHAIDLKAARAELAQKAIRQVHELFGMFTAEHTVTGWYEGVMSTGTIPRPTSGDMKNYATAIGILIDKHLVLIRHDSDDRDLPALDRWLEAMMTGKPTT